MRTLSMMGSDMSVDASDASTPRLREYNGLTSSSLSLSGSDDDAVTVPYEDLPDDVFGMAICSLCRDIFFISRKEGSVTPRVARILASLLKVVFTVCMQVFLLIEIKHYVTPPTVYEVRKIYSMYEKQMYDKTEINYNNHFRGVSGFNASRFNDLRADEQESVCAIPLSRPFFFGVVLYLWTICNFVDLKITWGAAESLVFLTSSCRYMRDALALVDQNKHHRVFVISKLPIWMKAIIIVMVVLPRAVITLRVLYLGSRWLLATTPFGELVLNAVALEFVLFMSRMNFGAFVSKRSKIDLSNTKVLCWKKHPSNLNSFIGTTFFGLASLAWPVLYVGVPGLLNGWQNTLPDYRWDLREVCSQWYETHFCVDPPCTAGGKSMWFYLMGVG